MMANLLTITEVQTIEGELTLSKYPKTDYTYSPLSKDRVELAPGQVAMPNMSRRSLSQFRVQGPNTSQDELDRLSAATNYTSTTTLRRRYTSIDSSDDEWQYTDKNSALASTRGWLARALHALARGAARVYRRAAGPAHRYPYTDRRPATGGVAARAAAAAAAPFAWLYVLVTTVVTTVTTVTETITSNHTEHNEKAAAAATATATAGAARRWRWLLLLLLLPALGYGCYRHADWLLPPPGVAPDAYAPPPAAGDAALDLRVAALERWARGLDQRLRSLADDRHAAERLRRDLLQLLESREHTAALADGLRAPLDERYVTAERLALLLADVEARAARAGADDGAVHDLLAAFELRQAELVRELVREHVREHAAELQPRGAGADLEAVRRLVASMLDVYDADKTGLVDYALESAGGQVISTKCTELYQIKTKQYSVLGVPVLWVYTSPRHALTPGAMPAECWAFQGFPGYLVVRLYAIIEVTGFSLEHMSRLLAVDGKIESAPRNFSVYGLHGELDTEPHLFGDYTYDAGGSAIQYFPVQHPKTTDIGGVQYPVAFDTVELRVESNHGNPTYTCVYRFRVHGNPLTDVRRAAADTMRDAGS